MSPQVLYTIGQSVGRQLAELNLFDSDELDKVFLGMKDCITNAEPAVDLGKYSPMAAAMFQEKQMAKAEKSMKAGKEVLEAAAKVEGATKTDSGLVVLITEEGEGDSPTAANTVKVGGWVGGGSREGFRLPPLSLTYFYFAALLPGSLRGQVGGWRHLRLELPARRAHRIPLVGRD